MRVSIIIPNYNGESLMQHNIPLVLAVLVDHAKKTQDQLELILVDDGSTDNSATYIESQLYSWNRQGVPIKFFKQSGNKGFASTVNHGVQEAAGEIVVLLNSDVLPEKGFLVPLLRHFSNETMFAVGSMDKSIEKGETVLRGRGLGRWERGFLMHRAGKVDKTDTLWVSCGSGAFRKSLWASLGGLNELMNPFYWEDIDISYRAQKAGYTVLFEPESIVIHEHEKGAIQSLKRPTHVTAIVYRNQFIFTWTNITDFDLGIKHSAWLPYHMLKALMRGDRAFFTGLFNALALLPSILRMRKKYQALVKKTDHEVLSPKNV